nr:sialokinin I=vasodilatory tachykinin [Aedes aegypti=yellow fever mosquitoes, Rockefeller, salivary glands, Peptide, 10 aa] [Aedes aegypti]
NTGDKFYGLM